MRARIWPCAAQTHMDRSQEQFCVMYRKNAGPQFRRARFVRACAVETHMDISQERFVAFLHETMPRATWPTWIQWLNTGPFTLTVRTSSVWPYCLANKRNRKFRILQKYETSHFAWWTIFIHIFHIVCVCVRFTACTKYSTARFVLDAAEPCSEACCSACVVVFCHFCP